MKIANVVLKKVVEESSETRRTQRTFVRLASIEVTSISAESDFVPLADQILLTGQETVASVLSVQPDMNFFKDSKPTKIQPAKNLDFHEKRFAMCAVVELPFTRVFSRDPFGPSQTYQPQVVLFPMWGQIELPQNAKLAGVIECEGFAVSAHDKETNENYRLGYRLQGDSEVNWVQLALARRKHWQRAEKEDTDPYPASVQMSKPSVPETIAPQNLVRVTDHLVRRQLKNFYPHQFLQAIGDLIEDPDHHLREAEEHVAGRRAALGNEQMLEREIYPELYV